MDTKIYSSVIFLLNAVSVVKRAMTSMMELKELLLFTSVNRRFHRAAQHPDAWKGRQLVISGTKVAKFLPQTSGTSSDAVASGVPRSSTA